MLTIANKSFSSRLFTGTGKFRSAQTMSAAIQASKSELVTLAMKRVEHGRKADETLSELDRLHINLLPNTSGAVSAKEAVYAARLARAALDTPWIKLEIHPDQRYLLPDPVETLLAAEQLVKEGFVVLPYCSADPVLCRRLEEAGCAAVMPLAAPIGSNRGLLTKDFLHIIIEQASVPVVIDAGIGKPSEAMAVMEMGADAVLVNTAIATAHDPVNMAALFAQAVSTGRRAYEAGLAHSRLSSSASSPLTRFLNET
ncbi:thiazole synthase [Alteromonas ponticola]|uniref:Thiazole synthase n=1 Tax=Alteromonas ponticola TaxID=2720613 RepID=A0ABX1R3L3_9ALTE|nr:thiazole synthase [Alteromonas ponticola]NMH59848.1 thiazole synthase [Alteromonas ponticola]